MRRHFEVARPGGKTHTLFLAVGTWWFFLLFCLFSVPVPGGSLGSGSSGFVVSSSGRVSL